MKQAPFQKIRRVAAAVAWLGMISTAPLFAIDLGVATQSPDTPQKVEVVDQPVKVATQEEGVVMEMTPDVSLELNGIYESDYIDVRAYRSVTFYVTSTDDSSIKIKSATAEPPILYQLDAFFSAEIGSAAKLMAFGDDQPRWMNHQGAQEFGNVTVNDDGSEGRATFTKLSTGRTHSRCLYTPVFGPYVRVILRNFTAKDKQNYQVVAYLSH